MFYLLLWIILAVAVGKFSEYRGSRFAGGFILSLLLSPLIGFFIVLLQKAHRCPYCKESIRRDAVVCKHCGRNLSTSFQTGDFKKK